MTELLPSGASSKQFDNSSKFQILNRGSLLPPACCASCGGSDAERAYLDLGMFIDYYGQVYFCKNCVSDMAERIGLLNETEIEFLKHFNETVIAELAELKIRYEEEHGELEHYRALFNANGSRISESSSVVDSEESESSSKSVIESGEEQSESNESSEGEGLTESLRIERDDASNRLDL